MPGWAQGPGLRGTRAWVRFRGSFPRVVTPASLPLTQPGGRPAPERRPLGGRGHQRVDGSSTPRQNACNHALSHPKPVGEERRTAVRGGERATRPPPRVRPVTARAHGTPTEKKEKREGVGSSLKGEGW